MALGSQTRATTSLAIKSISRRPASSASTVLAIALVVLVLFGFLSMGNGYRQVVEMAGSPDTAIILRDGATTAQGSALGGDQLALLSSAPGVKQVDGNALISPELTIAASIDRSDNRGIANLVIRGITPESDFMTRGVKLIEGRAPTAGSNEMIVGRAAFREFPGLSIGSTVHLAATDWRIVGVFSAGGSVYESEARADLHVVQSIFQRGPTVQSARVQLAGASSLKALQDFLHSNPQGGMVAQSENAYFQNLARTTGTFIDKLGWPLALLMALGALAGAGHTMYSSVEARMGEILTLRTLGFGRSAIFLGVLAESLLLAVIGAALGVIVGWLIFDGLETSTAGKSFGQVAFELHVSNRQIIQAFVLATAIGLLGGLPPAIKAARMPLALAGRE